MKLAVTQNYLQTRALDRILYTDSVMAVRNRFVLNTMTLSPDDLAILGLEKSDVLYDEDPTYYDHLPLVVDFQIIPHHPSK